MRLIKFALIAMGLLIIAGFIFLGVVSYQRMTGSGYFGKTATRVALETQTLDIEALATVPTAPTVAALGLPDGARVEAIHEVGNRVLLLVRQAAIGDRLYLIDPRTGAVTAAIALGTEAPTLPPAATPTPHAPLGGGR